ncbi:MAG TPA: DUF1585 domain-containing protein [Steroidobacteraceae bacterium]|nr:DUF1585 domain-containing protein [Steroidobacteraceae bacterium]
MKQRARLVGRRRAISAAVAGAVLLAAQSVSAGPREQAKRLHDRLAGTPPSAQVLDAMAADISAGRAVDAAYRAMESSSFYRVTLKNFATPWTNREQTVFAPLNDYTATVIGMVRDDVPFNEVLSADILYVANGVSGVPAYSPVNNDHYQTLEDTGADLKQVLARTTQSSVSGLPPDATAGVMTTRAAAQAFFIAGTNRAMFRFTLMNHLCRDLEQVQDTTRPPDRIRQDVSRSPGGDSRIFLNNCVGCHSGMDPLAQAFAYYDFDETTGRIEYTSGQVQPKYFNNEDTFPPGYRTPDDHWTNYWRQGTNALLGWGAGPGAGTGAKSLGQELANSDAFARCQVEKVFRDVCFRSPSDAADRSKVDQIVASFRSSNYRLKQVFAESAVYCMGD